MITRFVKDKNKFGNKCICVDTKLRFNFYFKNFTNMSFNDKIIRSPFQDVPIPKNVTLTEFFLSKAARYGNRPAMICSKTGRKITFDQLITLTKQLAESLKSYGIKKHEVVGICLQSGVEYLPLVLAITSIEAVCATSNPSYTVDELNHNFSLAKVSYVVIDSNNDEKVMMVSQKYPGIKQVFLPKWENDVLKLAKSSKFRSNNSNASITKLPNPNVRFLFSSSGTSGPPKAVMLTEKNLKAFLCAFSPNSSRDGTMKMFSFSTNDIVLSVFPHFHVGGLVMTLMASTKEGATSVILPKYQTKNFLECIENYKPTVLIAPPPVYVFLTKSQITQDLKIPSLKNAYVAGSPAGKELIDVVCKKFSLDYMIEGYGLSELSSVSHVVPICDKSKNKHGSCGVLLANGLGKVIDVHDGHALGPYERGEICYKSDQVMPGYLNNEKATKESLDSDNWLHTGDIGYYDEDNYFYIVDRLKELIKVKGYQVAPAELEDVLMSHPAVTDAAVVGIKDEYAGELPRAYIVKNAKYNVTVEDIKKYVSEKVIAYKRLEGGVVFVDEILKGPSGKILRRLLRDKAQSESKNLSKL